MRIVAAALGAAVCSAAILASAATAGADPGRGAPGGPTTDPIAAALCTGHNGIVVRDPTPLPGEGRMIGVGRCQGGKYNGYRVK